MIQNGLRTLLLGQKCNVCGVEPMEIFRVKIREKDCSVSHCSCMCTGLQVQGTSAQDAARESGATVFCELYFSRNLFSSRPRTTEMLGSSTWCRRRPLLWSTTTSRLSDQRRAKPKPVRVDLVAVTSRPRPRLLWWTTRAYGVYIRDWWSMHPSLRARRREELAGGTAAHQLDSPTRARRRRPTPRLASPSQKSKVLSHALTACGSCDSGLILIDQGFRGKHV
jgi:hypothetical protein